MSVTEQNFTTRNIKLKRSGIIVTIPDDWEVKDTEAAQRAAKGKAGRFQWYLMQRVCLFNGDRWTLARIEDAIKGKDGLQLLGEFFGDDEDEEAGNDPLQ